MAEVLEQHDFASTGIHGKYPWTKWLDGQIWKLRKHVDYDCTTDSFKQAAYAWARRHDIIVQIHMDQKQQDEFVILQARK